VHGCCWRRRRRCGRAGRPPKPLRIAEIPQVEKIVPSPKLSEDPIYLDLGELEALRLIDLEKLTFEEAGVRMSVSRNTVWRLVESGREKLVKAILEGREVVILK